jgi:glycosyltransferase involved in cell wall biosynthesis
MEDTLFNLDSHPGKPKILFVGHGSSSHTLAWIDSLANTDFNVRLFCLPGTCPPDDWPTRAYVILPTRQLPKDFDTAKRKSLRATPNEIEQKEFEIERRIKDLRRNWLYWLIVFWKKILNSLGTFLNIPRLTVKIDFNWPDRLQIPPAEEISPEAWLAEIIENWNPDIVHTLGLDPAGKFYLRVQNLVGSGGFRGKWILQLRGGSDLTLSRFDEKKLPEIKEALRGADQIISDNYANFDYIKGMGISSEKFAPLSPIPGTGGIDVQKLAGIWQGKPSQRRIIVWPKAYDCEWSVALPVFEAIQMVWAQIQPCEIYMFVMVIEGTRMWYNALPREIRGHCHVYERVPRDELLALMSRARVMLAPSLVDGIPNSMYEAMACGAFPIVSPLETILSVVKNEQNVLFARNLYPQEIAAALARAMTDDDLVDRASVQNLELVQKLAGRSILTPKIIAYYETLAGWPGA